MGKILRVPVRKTILATATSLTASYAKIGSAINIEGMLDLTLHLHESANVENALIKPYVAISGDAPTSNSGLYQLCDNTGAEIEFTVLKNERASMSLKGVSGKYLLFYGKGAVGTDADITAFVTGNIPRLNGQTVERLNATVLSSTELSSTSYADKGNVINIEGYDNLTLHVAETGTTEGASIKVFVAHTGDAPTATTNLQQFTDKDGAELEFTVLKGEKASFPLEGLTGKYLMIQAKKTAVGTGNATVEVKITGSAANL